MENLKGRLHRGRKALWPLWTACALIEQTAPHQVWWRELNQVSLLHIQQHYLQIVRTEKALIEL